jgi:hypothetical protein
VNRGGEEKGLIGRRREGFQSGRIGIRLVKHGEGHYTYYPHLQGT